MAIFPGAISSFTGFTSSHTLVADAHASQHNSEQAEIVAVQTKVGTGASTPTGNTVLRGTGVGTSSWGQAILTTDVSGVLPIANGGTGQTTLNGLTLSNPNITGTVTGSATYSTPVLSIPTITNFTNATHNHQNATGGGTLAFASLMSTIFSSQVTTYTNGGTAGGTFNYINLGGIKLLWGVTAQQSSHNNPSYSITYPVGFFATVQSVTMGVFNLNIDGNQFVNSSDGSYGPASIGLYFNDVTNSVGALLSASIFVIGT